MAAYKLVFVCLVLIQMIVVGYSNVAKPVRSDLLKILKRKEVELKAAKEHKPPQPEEELEKEIDQLYDEDKDLTDEEALFGDGEEDPDALRAMPKHERIDHLKQHAEKHDLNKDGYISFHELETWVAKSLIELQAKEAIEFLESEDSNKDSKLSFEEVSKDLNLSDKSATGKRQIEDEKRVFEAADRDSDGFISSSEIPAFYDPYDFSYMHDAETSRRMSELDHDLNGKLTVEEFASESGKDEIGEPDSELVIEFRKLDKDSNEELSHEEFKAYAIKNTGAEAAAEEAQELIKASDLNHDKHLSINELVQHEEEFLESAIWHYGEKNRVEL